MDTHNDQETVDSFLHWLASKASGLSNRIPLNKNQLQGLLLEVALILRDPQFSCFSDPEGTSIPLYLMDSCMQPPDIQSIASIVEAISEAIYKHKE